MSAVRAELESLLRARKLDVTLTTGPEWDTDEDRVAPTGWAVLDRALGGGLRRGHLTEIVGARSSGRTAVFCRAAAESMARGEVVALVDTHDRFDPVSAQAAGMDLARLLWIRDSGNHERALKALHLVLQAGGFGIVALDCSEVRGPALRGFPHTTWMRIARAIEGSPTAALLIASEHVARSAGGATIALESPPRACAGGWSGTTARARRLQGLPIAASIASARAR